MLLAHGVQCCSEITKHRRICNAGPQHEENCLHVFSNALGNVTLQYALYVELSSKVTKDANHLKALIRVSKII